MGNAYPNTEVTVALVGKYIQLHDAYISVVEALNEIPAAEDSPHEDDTLLREIMNLKPKYKEVILLFYYQDMKISEIARVLDAPESTVSVRLKRAREQLKKRLEGWYADGK